MAILVSIKTIASFDVDPLKGFTPLCPDELPVPDGDQIVDELNEQAKFAAYRIISKDVHPSNAIWIANDNHLQLSPISGDNVDLRWNKHCMSGTYGSELLDGLPGMSYYDFLVFKGVEPDMHPYSACYHDLKKKISTGVMEWAIGKGIETFIVGGLALDYCVGETVKDLINEGFNVILNVAATRGLGTPDELDNYLMELDELGVNIIKNASILHMGDEAFMKR